MIKVLVVDDSRTARESLRQALTSDGSLEVVAEAADGRQAWLAIENLKPQIITMDLFLHGEDGLELTAQIMKASPRPIILVTAADTTDPSLLFRAIRLGALDVFPKLPSPVEPRYEEQKRRLVRLVRALADVPVVHRHGPSDRTARGESRPSAVNTRPAAVVIGASTGGPVMLEQILRGLPRAFALPIAIAQHMSVGFTPSLVGWLSHSCGRKVEIVRAPTNLEAGHIYVADDDTHLMFSSHRTITISTEPPRCFARPSVDVLFESAARQLGDAVLGVLLTGMGQDGKEGLLALKRSGAITVAQDPESCAVDSMPRQAISANAALRVLDPTGIISLLQTL